MKKKLRPERELAMRLIAFTYQACVDEGRPGINLYLSGLTPWVKGLVAKGTFEEELADWFPKILWARVTNRGADWIPWMDKAKEMARLFVEKNRDLIAEGVLST